MPFPGEGRVRMRDTVIPGQQKRQGIMQVNTMDDTDLLLLHLLEENSQVTAGELAVMVEKTAVEVERRIAAMEAAGIIRSFNAVIDWEKAGNGVVSAIIELKVNPERDYGYDRIADGYPGSGRYDRSGSSPAPTISS
jgi:AsnC-type helix-turn-helix domain